MKKILRSYFTTLAIAVAALLPGSRALANHLVGMDLTYTWVSGTTYKITLVAYGDCGSVASSTAFSMLPTATPHICIYNGNSYWNWLQLSLESPGTEITPVCPDSAGYTQCTSLSYTIPGIKRYVYSNTITLPSESHYWRFLFTGQMGNHIAGRATAITNMVTGSSVQLIDTLDNTGRHNSSPIMAVLPTPYYCVTTDNCYNPGAYDPDSDSLSFGIVNAINGSASSATSSATCTAGASVTYIGAGVTGPTPLNTTGGSFAFDALTGQICFNSPVLQRSVAVYNIREYRNDTFVGSMQREMTFLLLSCTNPPPDEGVITPSTVAVQAITATSFAVCGNAGSFCLNFDPTDEDPLKTITVTATGLTGTGLTFTVTDNGTTTPHCTLCGNASLMSPGLITIYITMTDNKCPITGTKTFAITLQVYPVPTITYNVLTNATCLDKSIVQIVPGGTGKPWTIKVVDTLHTADTIQTFVDSVAFLDTLPPGVYYNTIFTSVTNKCPALDTMVLNPPFPIPLHDTIINPDICGINNGKIILDSIPYGTIDTIKYRYNGVWQPQILATPGLAVNGDSIFIPNLYAGTYDSIVVKFGFCTTDTIGPLTLVNPPFIFSRLDTTRPSKCGFCDGKLVFHGLMPGQQDTLQFNVTRWDTTGAVTMIYPYYVGSDSNIVVSGVCPGSYSGISIHFSPSCSTTIPDFILPAPGITAAFDTSSKAGCHGDTVFFTNHSMPAEDLSYHWYFGDGSDQIADNPVHIYTNTTSTYTVKLFITNSKCIDSAIKDIPLNNSVHAGFTLQPTAGILCQNVPDTLTNTSTGGYGSDPLSYSWYFGDGNGSTSSAAVLNYTYTRVGTYQVMLVAANTVPCYDTAVKSVSVDSISGMRIDMTDSVLCGGQGANMQAVYAHVGDTSLAWSISDGFNMLHTNPVFHPFDGPSLAASVEVYTVSVTVKFRACPDETASRTVTVFSYPNINLGPDTAMCPGSSPIVLMDTVNSAGAGAHWSWSTGETTPGITVTAPGWYTNTVTVNGCSASDTIWVANDCYMSIPNVFTPNGDGVNDYFFPRQFLTRGVVKFSMNIYNRWGQAVYQTTNTDGLGWDGAFNNIPQPGGVYVYIIDVSFKDGQHEHHQGNVTLLR